MTNESELPAVLLEWSTLFFRRTMQDFTRYARATGLSLVQMNVLIHLYYKGEREVMDLTELMQVSPAAASQMVERMAQQGLVRRVETPEDRRVRLVQLTDAGIKAVEDSIDARRQWTVDLMAHFSEDEKARIASALRLLTERAALLEAQDEQGG
jgi:DNA-binding MarR family transcriptional regulator